MFVRLNYGGKEGPLINTDNVIAAQPSATVGNSTLIMLGLVMESEIPLDDLEKLLKGEPISTTPLEI